MELADLRTHLMRRWWIVVAAAALAGLGAATATANRPDYHQRTIHFALRPDASVTKGDLPGALAALESKGSLVQTVIGVLGGRGMLRRAGADADMPFSDAWSLEAKGRPGSALIDSTLAAPDDAAVERLTAGYTRAATKYVTASYSAYVLDRLSVDSGGTGTVPGAAQIVIISALAGAVLGIGLVAIELRFESRRRARGAHIRSSRLDPSRQDEGNGSGRLPEPEVRAFEPLGARSQTPAAGPQADSSDDFFAGWEQLGKSPGRRNAGPRRHRADRERPAGRARPAAPDAQTAREKPAFRPRSDTPVESTPADSAANHPPASRGGPNAFRVTAVRPPPDRQEPDSGSDTDPAGPRPPGRQKASPPSKRATRPEPATRPKLVTRPNLAAQPKPANRPKLVSRPEPTPEPKPDTRRRTSVSHEDED
jgi:hypothetical protein